MSPHHGEGETEGPLSFSRSARAPQSVCLSLILWFWAKNKRRPPTLRFTPHPMTKTEPPACSLEPQQRGASKEPRCRGDGRPIACLP